jgi:hypothetical protein
MIKFGLGKLFQYNSELDAFQLFHKVEVWWRDGTWYRPKEWVFDYKHTDCDCNMFDIGWFGITILSKGCGRDYE